MKGLKALLVIDIQNDFCEGGALAVKDANSIIPYINKLMSEKEFNVVAITKDWHPKNHSSFKVNHTEGIWPVHCVQGEYGSELHSDLKTKYIDAIFQKGMNVEVDSYSGFFDNDHKNSTGLGEYLQKLGVEEVVVVGLALDYCVKFTALDALKFGFKTSVDLKGTKAVNLSQGDDLKAIQELKENGIHILNEV